MEWGPALLEIRNVKIVKGNWMKKGDKVKYVGCSEAQYNYGNGDDPRKILIEGQELIIEAVEVYNWHTRFKFKGVEGKFNSVCFRKVGNGK